MPLHRLQLRQPNSREPRGIVRAHFVSNPHRPIFTSAHVILAALCLVFRSVLPESALADESLPRIPATAPEDAAATIQLQHGFRAELIATEPLVTDPIAIQYDEKASAEQGQDSEIDLDQEIETHDEDDVEFDEVPDGGL